MKPHIDEEKLQKARVKSSEQYLRMGEACALVQAECDLSRSQYYKTAFEYVKEYKKRRDVIESPRVQKADVWQAIDEFREGVSV